MQRHGTDEGVFSSAAWQPGDTWVGFLAPPHDVIKVMDAMRKDVIMVETVGVGQDEVDIVDAADTSIVVLVPGLGDGIQAMKAGILEIGDIFVINKCEQEGADRFEQELKIMLEMGGERPTGWTPQIYRTEAIKGEGIEELVAGVERHRAMLHGAGFRERQEAERAKSEFLELLKSSVMKRLLQRLREDGELDRIVNAMVKREVDPYTVVEKIVEAMLR